MGFTIKFHSVHPEQRTAKPAMAPYPYPIQCRTVTAAGLQRVWRQAAGRRPPCTCCKRRKDAGPRESPMHGTAAALPVLFLLERSPCRDPARDTSRPASRRVEPWTHLSRPGINCMSAAARQPEQRSSLPAFLCAAPDATTAGGPPCVRRLVATRVVLQLELATVWLAVAATASKMPLSLCCGVVVRARWRSAGKQEQSSFSFVHRSWRNRGCLGWLLTRWSQSHNWPFGRTAVQPSSPVGRGCATAVLR